MDEATLQFIIKIFAILVASIMTVIVATLAYIVIRDGNNVLVQSAFSEITTMAQWIIGVVGAILVVKPVATSAAAIMQARADYEAAKTNVLNITHGQQVPSTPEA